MIVVVVGNCISPVVVPPFPIDPSGTEVKVSVICASLVSVNDGDEFDVSLTLELNVKDVVVVVFAGDRLVAGNVLVLVLLVAVLVLVLLVAVLVLVLVVDNDVVVGFVVVVVVVIFVVVDEGDREVGCDVVGMDGANSDVSRTTTSDIFGIRVVAGDTLKMYSSFSISISFRISPYKDEIIIVTIRINNIFIFII